MGKLMEMYNLKKKQNQDCLYIIHSGVFYIGVNEDAKKLNDLLQLKITNIDNKGNIKCGFPTSRLDFYKNLLDKLNVNYELVELSNCNENVGSSTYSDKENTKNIMKIIDYISKLDLDEISPKDAYNILEKLNTKCKSYFFD